ncbi:protein furry [Anaeramoeba flamelloides]|uniref:Protein furry n=1 Tax=Anaeramoeba flamelloides TaxID=1746091 RepID=A0AAV7YZU3_9EUKA|nr:protein furry [Anaeramoeba flamelloides]
MDTSFNLLQKVFSHFTGLANLYVNQISGIESVEKFDLNNNKLLTSVIDSLTRVTEHSVETVCEALIEWRCHKVLSSGIKTKRVRLQRGRSFSRVRIHFDHTISPKDFNKYNLQSKDYSTNLKTIATEIVFLYTSLKIFKNYHKTAKENKNTIQNKGKKEQDKDEDEDEKTKNRNQMFESYIDLCFKQILNFETLLKLSSKEDIKILNLKSVLITYEELLNLLCEIDFEKCSKLILKKYIQKKVNYKILSVEGVNKIFSCISLKVNNKRNIKKSIKFLKNIYTIANNVDNDKEDEKEDEKEKEDKKKENEEDRVIKKKSRQGIEKILFLSNILLNTYKKSKELKTFFENEEWINLMREYLKLSKKLLQNSKTIFFGLKLMVSSLCCLDQNNFEKNIQSFLQISLNNKFLSNKYKNEIIKILSYFVECIIIRFSQTMEEKKIKKILNLIVNKLFFDTKKTKNAISDKKCYPYLISIILSVSKYDLTYTMESIILKLAKSGKKLFPKVSLSIRAFHKLWIKYNKNGKNFKGEETKKTGDDDDPNNSDDDDNKEKKKKNEIKKYLTKFEILLKESVKITDQQIGNINWYSQNKVHQELITRDKPEYLQFFYYLSKIIPIILPYPEQIISIFVKYTLHQQQDIALHSFNALKRIVQNQPDLRPIIIHEFSKFISQIPFHFFKLIEFSLNQLNQLLQIWHDDLMTEDGFHDIRLLDMSGMDHTFDLIVDFDIEKVESICLLMLVYLEKDIKILAFKNLELINKINKLLIKQLKEFDYELDDIDEYNDDDDNSSMDEEENNQDDDDYDDDDDDSNQSKTEEKDIDPKKKKKKLFQQTRVIEIFIKKGPLLFSKSNSYKWSKGNIVFPIDFLFLRYKNLKKIENNDRLKDHENNIDEEEKEVIEEKVEEILEQYKELIQYEDSANEYKYIYILSEIIKEISNQIPNIIKIIFPILKNQLKELNDFILKKLSDKRSLKIMKKNSVYNLKDELQRWENYSMVLSSCSNPDIIKENEIKNLLLLLQKFYNSSINVHKDAAILSLSKIHFKSFHYVNGFLKNISKVIFNKQNKKKGLKKRIEKLSSITIIYRLFLDQLTVTDFHENKFIQQAIYLFIQKSINYFLSPNFNKKLINLTLKYNLFLLFRTFSILMNNNDDDDYENLIISKHNKFIDEEMGDEKKGNKKKQKKEEKNQKEIEILNFNDRKKYFLNLIIFTGFQKEGKDRFNFEKKYFEHIINPKFKNEEKRQSLLEIFINESKSIQFVCLQIMSELLKGQIFETDILKKDKSIILSWIYELLLSNKANYHRVAKVAIQNLFQNNENELLDYYLKKSYSAKASWAKGFVLSICNALYHRKIQLPIEKLINFLIYNIGSISKSIRFEIVKLWNLYKTEILTEEQIKTLPVITSDQAEIPERIYEQRRHLSNLLSYRRKDLSFKLILEAAKRYTILQHEINSNIDFKSRFEIHYRKDCILEYLIHWIQQFEYIHGNSRSKKQFHQIFASLLTITMKNRPLNTSFLDGIWTALSIKSKNISGIVQSLFSCSIGDFQIEYLLTSKQIIHHFNKFSKEKLFKIVLKDKLLQYFTFKKKKFNKQQLDNEGMFESNNGILSSGSENNQLINIVNNTFPIMDEDIGKDNSMDKITRLDFVIVLLSEIIIQISESLIFLKLPLLLQIILLGFDHKQEFVKRHSRLLLSNLIIRVVMNKKEIENQLALNLSNKILKKITNKNYQFWKNETISITKINIESEIKLNEFLDDLLDLFLIFDKNLKENYFKESLKWIISKPNKDIYENKKHLFIVSRSHQIYRNLIGVPTETHIKELINNFQYIINREKNTDFSWIIYENLKTFKILIMKMESSIKTIPQIFWTLIALLKTKNNSIFELILDILNIIVDRDFLNDSKDFENKSKLDPNSNSNSNTNTNTTSTSNSKSSSNDNSNSNPNDNSTTSSKDNSTSKKSSNSDSDSIYDILLKAKPKNLKKIMKFQGLQPLIFNGFQFENTFQKTIILLSKLLQLPSNKIIQKGNIKFVQNIGSLLPFLIEIYPKKNYTFLFHSKAKKKKFFNKNENNYQELLSGEEEDEEDEDKEIKLRKFKKKKEQFLKLKNNCLMIINSIILKSEKLDFNNLANILKNFKNDAYNNSPIEFIKAIKKPFFSILTPKFKIKLFEFLLEMIGLCTKKYRINYFIFFEILFSDFVLTNKNLSQVNKKVLSDLIKNLGNEFTGEMTTIINKIINHPNFEINKKLKIEYETTYSNRSINKLFNENKSITAFYKGLNKFPIIINDDELLTIRNQFHDQLMKEKQILKEKLQLKELKKNGTMKSKKFKKVKNIDQDKGKMKGKSKEKGSNKGEENNDQENIKRKLEQSESKNFLQEIYDLVSSDNEESNYYYSTNSQFNARYDDDYHEQIMLSEENEVDESFFNNETGDFFPEFDETQNDISKLIGNYAGDTLRIKKKITATPMKNLASFLNILISDEEGQEKNMGTNSAEDNSLSEKDKKVNPKDDNKGSNNNINDMKKKKKIVNDLNKKKKIDDNKINNETKKDKEIKKGQNVLGNINEKSEKGDQENKKKIAKLESKNVDQLKDKSDDNQQRDEKLDLEQDILELERMLTIKETQMGQNDKSIIKIDEIILKKEELQKIKEKIDEKNKEFLKECQNVEYDKPVKYLTVINISTKLIQSKVEQYYSIENSLCNFFENTLKREFTNKDILSIKFLHQFKYNLLFKAEGDKYYNKLNDRLNKAKSKKMNRFQKFLNNRTKFIHRIIDSDNQYIQALNEIEEIIQNIQTNGFEKKIEKILDKKLLQLHLHLLLLFKYFLELRKLGRVIVAGTTRVIIEYIEKTDELIEKNQNVSIK